MDMGGGGSSVQFSQTLHGQRVSHDQRFVHVHKPEASFNGRMAETAASAMVSGVKDEAAQADFRNYDPMSFSAN